MPKHDPLLSIRQMLDFAREAESLLKNRTRNDIEKDRMLQLSLLKLLEMVGESASRIPHNEQARLPQVPWDNIIGMRHRLIHGYNNIDYDIVWKTITEDLPPLIILLEKIINQETM
jgi:uncharacterized protein with HEPN domain